MIRLATINDKRDIIHLLHLFKEESGYESRTSLAKFSDVLDEMMNNDNYLVLVLIKDKTIVGFLLSVVASSIFCDDIVANELAWFVHPDYRKGSGGLKLLTTFEYWAKEVKKVDYITLSTVMTIKDLGKFYNKRGYDLVETTYRKRVN